MNTWGYARWMGVRASAGLLFVLFAAGCAALRSEVNDADIQAVDDSLSMGTVNITQYEEALFLTGQMLEAYGCGVTTIQVRPIDNRTASKKLPADVTQMTITALNKMGRQVRIVDYDIEQLGIDLAIGTQTMERVVPDLALRGAITEFDLKVEKERRLGADASGRAAGYDVDAGVNYDTSAEGVTAAMDFQLLDYKTQTLVPGVQAANRINLFNSSKGGGMDLGFSGTGVDFRAKVKKSQGIHASLRLLVELSVAEVVGKYNQVPYWRCIPGSREDAAVIREYRQSLSARDDLVAVKKKLALAHGKTMDLFSGHISPQEAAALAELRKQAGVPETASDEEFITRLWLTVPLEQGAARMRAWQDRIRQQQAQLAAQAAQIERERKAEQQRQLQQQQESRRQEQEQINQRTTFKFGAQETF